MLTKNELLWLAERSGSISPDGRETSYFCRWCKAKTRINSMYYCSFECRKDAHGNARNDWIDAAEFEARVAAKIATAWKDMLDNYDYTPCDACPCHNNCLMDCHDNILKWARLAVEEEGLHWTART